MLDCILQKTATRNNILSYVGNYELTILDDLVNVDVYKLNNLEEFNKLNNEQQINIIRFLESNNNLYGCFNGIYYLHTKQKGPLTYAIAENLLNKKYGIKCL